MDDKELIKILKERLRSAEKALKVYSDEDYVLSGSDYQMYATSSSRHAFDDGGIAARTHFVKFNGDI